MYIASKRTSADFNGNQSIEASISSFKKDIRKEVGELKKLLLDARKDSEKVKSDIIKEIKHDI